MKRFQINCIYVTLMLLLWLPAMMNLQGQTLFGDYQGVFTDQGRYPLNKKNAECAAQVIDAGNNKYIIHLSEILYARAGNMASAIGRKEGNTIKINSENLICEISQEGISGKLFFRNDWLGFHLNKVEVGSPTLGALPTTEALVLFDGNGFDHWIGDGDKEVNWIVVNDNEAEVIPVTPGQRPKHDIITRQKFTDLYLHIEFKLPLMAESEDQQRANSGVIFEGIGEVQILDSYGLEGNYNECGAIYRTSPPKVNMCSPPLTWQTFDIIFHGPGYNKKGQKTEDGNITVYHNGKRVHYQLPLKKSPEQLNPGETEFPVGIRLQDHQNTLWFRNIWAIDLQKHPELPDFIKTIE
jgi:hypothetical protein